MEEELPVCHCCDLTSATKYTPKRVSDSWSPAIRSRPVLINILQASKCSHAVPLAISIEDMLAIIWR
jgi:hypothetical protein